MCSIDFGLVALFLSNLFFACISTQGKDTEYAHEYAHAHFPILLEQHTEQYTHPNEHTQKEKCWWTHLCSCGIPTALCKHVIVGQYLHHTLDSKGTNHLDTDDDIHELLLKLSPIVDSRHACKLAQCRDVPFEGRNRGISISTAHLNTRKPDSASDLYRPEHENNYRAFQVSEKLMGDAAAA